MGDPFRAGQWPSDDDLNEATEKTLDSAYVTTGGTMVTGITTTEVNVPKLALGPVHLRTEGLYEIKARLLLQNSVATDEFAVRVRRDTALSGAVVASWTSYRPLHTAGFWFNNWYDFDGSADEDVPFYLSLQRVSGTGNLTIYGNSALKITRTGYRSESRNVA